MFSYLHVKKNNADWLTVHKTSHAGSHLFPEQAWMGDMILWSPVCRWDLVSWWLVLSMTSLCRGRLVGVQCSHFPNTISFLHPRLSGMLSTFCSQNLVGLGLGLGQAMVVQPGQQHLGNEPCWRVMICAALPQAWAFHATAEAPGHPCLYPPCSIPSLPCLPLALTVPS